MLKRLISKITVESAPSKKIPLVNAYNQECFFIHNGATLSNLKDLSRILGYITETQFKHHVTSEKNDFAKWVENVLRDPGCATKLRKAKTQMRALEVVEERLRDFYL